MHLTAKSALVAGATALAATSFALPVARAQDAEPVHIALADLPEVETHAWCEAFRIPPTLGERARRSVADV